MNARSLVARVWWVRVRWGAHLGRAGRNGGQRGATAIEYGLMIALIAAVVFSAVAYLGSTTGDSFSCTATSVRTGAAC